MPGCKTGHALSGVRFIHPVTDFSGTALQIDFAQIGARDEVARLICHHATVKPSLLASQQISANMVLHRDTGKKLIGARHDEALEPVTVSRFKVQQLFCIA